MELRRAIAVRRGRVIKTFEATPDYLFDPRAPARAAELLPTVKCIVTLRDPVERAYSHYHHNVRLGQEDLSFADAIAAEEERLADDRRLLREDPYDRVLYFRRFSYLSRGSYAEQITRWLEHFPRESFHFVMADDLFKRPEATFHEILRFLDLPIWSPSEFRNHSYTAAHGSTNPKISTELRESLQDHFEAQDVELSALLDTSLPWRLHI
jgi:hypothetical protein